MRCVEGKREPMSVMTEKAKVRTNLGALAQAGLLGLVLATMACGNNSPDTNGAADASANTQPDAGVVPIASPTVDLDPSVVPSADASVDSLTCDPTMAICGGRCVDFTMDHDNCGACPLACAASEVCFLGQCNQTCPAGTTECGGGCADFQSDLHHCGGCSAVDAGSFACESDQVCRRGRCAAGCDAPLVS